LIGLAGIALSGCTRTAYRQRADRQSYQILAQKITDERWAVPELDITPDPRSRFHDPYDPDFPPLPPDDPAAHQYMHRVDGKLGWRHWHRFGDTERVENPDWPVYLGGEPLTSAQGRLPNIDKITLERAIELGLIHSREYQEQMEDVYLGALALTHDRYRFDLRPSGFLGEPGTEIFHQHQPDDASDLMLGPTNFGVRKLLPTGAQLVAELTNNTIWMFSGGNGAGTASTFAYSIVQPLLAGAGREIVLEDLTQAERNVLYAIRRFARFRKDFYVMIVTGERALPLPGSTGGSELAFLIRGERAPTVGFYFLLFQYQRLRNRAENVQSLEMRLRDVQAMLRDGKAATLDVTQVQTSLEHGRFSRTIRERFFGDQLDRFKLQLGLPPDLELEIDDSVLEQFQFRNPQLTDLQDDLRRLDSTFQELAAAPDRKRTLEVVRGLIAIRGKLASAFEAAAGKLEQLQRSLPSRIGTTSPEAEQEFGRIVAEDSARFEQLHQAFEGDGQMLQGLQRSLAQQGIANDRLTQILGQAVTQRDILYTTTRRLSSLEAATRVELIELTPVHLTPSAAVDLALENRLDLMNRRALVMDARRRLEIAADRLEGTLDVIAEGAVNTPPLLQNSRAYDFRAKESEFRVGVAVKTPVDRRRERNDFRAAQIAYQRARRNYIAAEDQVKLDVRSELRDLKAQRELFEIQRRALRVAAMELEQALEAGERQADGEGEGRQQGLNIPRALENILDAQDELIEAWVEYETARMELFRDVGVMKIDANGLWPQAQQREDSAPVPDSSGLRGAPSPSL